MKLPWRQTGHESPRRRAGAREAGGAAHTSPGLSRALERVLKLEQPSILDLGPLCGDTAVRLAGQGARVSVEVFAGPPPRPPRDAADDADEAPPPPIRLDQPDAQFDLVLAWEHVDFVPPDRLREFGGEIRRVLAPGGFVLLFARNARSRDAAKSGRPGRYRLLEDNLVARERDEGPTRRRWVHPTRAIERALAPLAIQGLHLQRNQMREFLAQRSAG